MITRIEIDGFKSFVDFSVDLHPFTAVIGTNASGKSNLVDAFRFLAELAKGDLYDAVEAVRGDAESLLHQFSDGSRVNTMRFAVEFLVAADDLEAELAGATRSWSTGKVDCDLAWRMELFYAGFAREWLQEFRRRSGRRTTYPRPFRWSNVLEAPERRRPCQGQRSSGVRKPRPHAELGPIEDLPAGGTPHCVSCPEVGDRPDMALDGAGLPGYLDFFGLHASEVDPRAVLRSSAASELVPDVSGFDVLADEVRRDVRVHVHAPGRAAFRGCDRLRRHLRALAFLAMLKDPPQLAPDLIDEPGNGIYPEHFRRLVRTMMESARITPGPSPGPAPGPAPPGPRHRATRRYSSTSSPSDSWCSSTSPPASARPQAAG